MKRKLLLHICTLMLVSVIVFANNRNSDSEKTSESPYFLVLSENGVENFPLLSTKADVNISGVIADVLVTQTYKNDGKKPIEAKYVFPASINAAVYDMKMTIGDRIIKAEIFKKQEAKQRYEEAKKEGRSASLLEQERPNVFTMNVANIMPGDLIKVEMRYTELIVPENKEYEFVYPTVVGPRFVDEDKDTSGTNENKFTNTPYTREGEKPFYDFDINISMKTGIPVSKVYSGSHKINAEYVSNNEVSISLDKGENKGGNKDFILKYKLVGDQIESGLLLHESQDEKYFLMMLQPPERVNPSELPPREYIFILDVSGSMTGFPLTIGKKLLVKLMKSLNPTDKFNIMLFSGGSQVFKENSVSANRENMLEALDFIDNTRGGGGTQLLKAMDKALKMERDEKISTSFVVLTDGYVNIEAKTYDLIRDNLGNANIFTFGIGSSVNRAIIDGMAHVGMGEPFIVTDRAEASEKADIFIDYIKNPILTNIKLEFDGFQAYDIEPKTIPDLMADRPILVYGKYRGNADGNIKVSGFTDKDIEVVFDAKRFGQYDPSPALKYLWVRKKIQLLDDYSGVRYGGELTEKIEKEVTDLGLKYNLLTKYTSFLAVDYKVRNENGKTTLVKQPLPLPEGVSDNAIRYDDDVIKRSKGVQSGGSGLQIRGNKNIKVGAISHFSSDDNYLQAESEKPMPIDKIAFDKNATYNEKDIYKYLIYPFGKKKEEIEKEIEIRVLVNKDGKVNKWNEKYNFEDFDFYRAAFLAIKKIDFKPAKNGEENVPVWLDIPVSFKLKEGKENIRISDKNYEFHISKNGLKSTTLQKGNGEKIELGDEVKISYQVYNDKYQLTAEKSESILKFIAGIGEVEKMIDKSVKGMKREGEKIIIIPAYLLDYTYPNFDIKAGVELALKIKILEVNK